MTARSAGSAGSLPVRDLDDALIEALKARAALVQHLSHASLA
ncbi:hypothetical protein [Oleisolibacter albus]|nr:hypothetical protein [Oleisolibacter albus]